MNQDKNIRRALLSVFDKTGLVPFATELIRLGFELVSTGGTLQTLKEAGLVATGVSDITRFAEVFGGRVKTLHPLIHGAILYRRDNDDDRKVAADLEMVPIDLVVVNLYPFSDTVSDPDVELAEAIEMIDIGGPTLIRGAAKNFNHVGVVVDPAEYGKVSEELIVSGGSLSQETREQLALNAFEHTAAYDTAIVRYLRRRQPASEATGLPEELRLTLTNPTHLRYGENPHQKAAIYESDETPLLAGGVCLQGKALSHNNIIDTEAALAAVAEFEGPAVVISKHTNPCGVGIDSSELLQAYDLALAGDPQSAFGGIIAMNRPCNEEVAQRIAKRFYEVVSAPSFTEAARVVLTPRKNLRLFQVDLARVIEAMNLRIRTTGLGMLVQTGDPVIGSVDEESWTIPTRVKPTEEQWAGLRFLWRVCKHVKSNAIVIGSNCRTYGVGAGQMSRVDAVRIALEKQTDEGSATCLASDAFFPFRDNIDLAASGGIKAIIEPGGSRRDPEVIEAADEHGIAMVFTGRRHFKH